MSGWRQTNRHESLLDEMVALTHQYPMYPVAIAVIPRADDDTVDLYGGAFGGLSTETISRIGPDDQEKDSGGAMGSVVAGQLAIIAVATAHVYGRQALKEKGS